MTLWHSLIRTLPAMLFIHSSIHLPQSATISCHFELLSHALSIPEMRFRSLSHHQHQYHRNHLEQQKNFSFFCLPINSSFVSFVSPFSHTTINSTTASRKSLTYGQGYVFTQRPLLINELLLIKVLRVDALYSGSLSFGLTTCPPQQLSSCSLPLDSHQLLNRPEYWVVIKDVLANAQPNDELGFCVNERNQLQMNKNGMPPVTLMHVDAGQRFFAFFDLFGRTTAIQVLGTKQLAPASSSQSISFPLPNTHGINSLSNSNTSGSLPYQRSGSLSQNNLSNHFAEMNKLEPAKSAKYEYSLSVDCKSPSLKKKNNAPSLQG